MPKPKPKPKPKTKTKTRPKCYFSISPSKRRASCLLWAYGGKTAERDVKYIERIIHMHRKMSDFQRCRPCLAYGRIYDGRGSIVFLTDDIRLQRIVAEELWSRHPLISWWVFSEGVFTLGKFMGDNDE